ncbi:MAG: cysteine--tRNA ligase [Planctomycetota bacterium]
MPIAIYNSLTRAKAPLQTLEPERVGMYVCGPTVYDDSHIGHLMGPVLFDAIARWLSYRGYQVRFVHNITDIDDKIIQRMRETGEDWQAITERYTAMYLDYLQALHVETITDHPRCSDFVDRIIAYIEALVARDIAYPATDGVYFDLRRHEGYGKLSGRDPADMLAGARIQRDDGLRNPGDFCLWKLAKPGEPEWPSPWGAGRPGWHIECTVMSSCLLGEHFDIHGGGDDLKFPHHENEIAQAEAHSGCYAACWMHNGLIQYEGAKISKSDPRMRDPEFAKQFKASWLLERFGPATLRFFLLQGHYRRPFDFAPQNLEAAQVALAKLHKQLGDLLDEAPQAGDPAADRLDQQFQVLKQKFEDAMDDDFNTGAAIGHLFAMAGKARKAPEEQKPQALRLLRDCGRLLGLFLPGDTAKPAQAIPAQEVDQGLVAGLMELVLELRQDARARRDFGTADRIREQLQTLGISVTDSKDGASWQLDPG